jgi:hypothetical protein
VGQQLRRLDAVDVERLGGDGLAQPGLDFLGHQTGGAGLGAEEDADLLHGAGSCMKGAAWDKGAAGMSAMRHPRTGCAEPQEACRLIR